MGTQYSQITIEERCEMARLRTAGHSIRQVAGLDRSPSTVSRELKRNDVPGATFRPMRISSPRWQGSRLERDAVRDRVLSRLQQGWSPEQVVGRLALECHLTRDHLSFHLRPARPQEGLLLASLPAAGQVETGVAGTQGRQSGVVYPSAPTAGGIVQRRPLTAIHPATGKPI